MIQENFAKCENDAGKWQNNADCETTEWVDDVTLGKRRVSDDDFTLAAECSDNETCEVKPNDPKPKPGAPLGRGFEVFCMSYAESHEGSFSKKLEKREIYLFSCKLLHKFMLTKKQVLVGDWCSCCSRNLANIRRFTAANRGELLNNTLGGMVRFRCERGHVWDSSYKKACIRWCKECSRNNKRLLKDLIQQENKRIEEEKRNQQVSSKEYATRGGKKKVPRGERENRDE